MKLPARQTLPALLAVLALFIGCSDNASETPLMVWSNDADTAFFLERYSLDTGRVVHFRYVRNLTEELTQQRVDADLVVGRWINSPPVQPMLQELPEGAALRPLAFSLGTLVYNPLTAEPLPPFTVTLDQIGEDLRPRGTVADAEELPPMRFVLSTQPGLLYKLFRIAGMTPVPDGQSRAQWDPQLHDDAFATIREWQQRWNGSAAAERAYREQYLYEPWFRQLETGRVLAVYLPSDVLMGWDFFENRQWDFRWIAGDDGGITALENVVYAGIPATSRKRSAALHLLEWLDDPQMQLRLVQDKIDHGVDSFGLFGGFSMHRQANDAIAAEVRPVLLGRLPDPGEITFPGTRPRYWDEARRDVLEPFLRDAAQKDDPPSGEDLVRILARWYDQRGD